jgi:hypothetical protein
MLLKTINIFIAFGYSLLIISCCTTGKTITKQNNMNIDKNNSFVSLPPGMADIKAMMLESSLEKEVYRCKIKVLEVFGYGPSISQIPEGKEIYIYIPKHLVKSEEKLEQGSITLARITEIKAMGDINYYELIMFNK